MVALKNTRFATTCIDKADKGTGTRLQIVLIDIEPCLICLTIPNTHVYIPLL